MSRIIDWLLNRIPIVRKLNGYKSYISFGIYVLSIIAQILFKAEILFPQVVGVGTHLADFTEQMISALESIGITGLGIGITHKVAKRNIAKKEREKA